MKSAFITYRGSRIHYRITGSGECITLCFHGFGEYAKTFDMLGGMLNDHCFIAIDLPFHGETEWEEGLDFTLTDLQQIIRQIPEVKASKFGLLGYSMGGRISLALLEIIPEQIRYMVLLAPDGLKVNVWYYFATQTWFGKRLFRYTMLAPGWFYQLLNLVKKTGLVNQSILKFVHRYIDDPHMRKKVYHTWITLRGFRPSLTVIKKQIRAFGIPVRLVYGRFDRIILPAPGKRFIKGIESFGSIHLIDSGHQVLHPKNIAAIREAITTSIKQKTSRA